VKKNHRRTGFDREGENLYTTNDSAKAAMKYKTCQNSSDKKGKGMEFKSVRSKETGDHRKSKPLSRRSEKIAAVSINFFCLRYRLSKTSLKGQLHAQIPRYSNRGTWASKRYMWA